MKNINFGNVLKMGIPFGLLMGLFSSFVVGNIIVGIIVGLGSGLFFGLVMSIFLKTMAENFAKNKPRISEEEPVILDGPANHFKGLEGVGGWLFLTSKALIFKSHSYNVQNHELMIPIDQISAIEKSLTLGLVPNGLLVKTKDGKSERFVVNNRKTWVQKITEIKK